MIIRLLMRGLRIRDNFRDLLLDDRASGFGRRNDIFNGGEIESEFDGIEKEIEICASIERDWDFYQR